MGLHGNAGIFSKGIIKSMSGMFETKSDKASRKLERTKKEEKAKRKTRIITITIISILVLVSASAILINSSFIRRTLPVVTIDGVAFSTTEFEYFFNTQYLEYMNMMSQFQGLGDNLPNPRRPLSTQVYNNETGETWADFFTELALSRMSNLTSLYNSANAANFTLTEEHLEEIEQELAMISLQAMLEGAPNTDSFLQQMFGNSINESTYRKILNFVSTAGAYSEFVRESFSYTPEQISGYYQENRDSLDVFNYRSFVLSHEQLDILDFESEEAYNAEVEASIEAVRLRAAQIVSEGVENADEFIEIAQRETDNYSDWIGSVQFRMGESLDGAFENWLRNDQRNYGDMTAIDSATGSTILYFVSRDDNTYKTVAMRQILILRDNIDPNDFPEGEADPAYISAIENAQLESHERAELVYSLFIAAGETENALLNLMAEHSDDTTEGGFYEDIARFSYSSSHSYTMKVVPEIEEWLFDENRKFGDSQLISTRDFGYHLVYFMGFGDPFNELIATDRMRTRDHNEWLDGLSHGQPVKHAAFILVHI